MDSPIAKITDYLAKPLKPTSLIYALLDPHYSTQTKDNEHTRRNEQRSVVNTQPPNVLIVEDNYINQQVVVGMLKNLNCDYTIAQNGQEALDALNTSKQTFDLVLMDCQMPLMDGYEATRQIRGSDDVKFAKDIPIVALTANAMKGDDKKCFDAGMNDYLEKPILSERLAMALRKWVSLERRQ
jgi:CheY-like chemotaxis protein